MRTINKSISIYKQVEDSITLVKEELNCISEDKSSKMIQCKVYYRDESDNIITVDNYNIKDDNYALLMSANPTFAPNKLANEYREDDLWYIIDLIRNENNAQ